MVDEDRAAAVDKQVEQLLRSAPRREEPPAATRESVRAAVHAEWQAVAGRRRRRRRTVAFAAAASVVIAIGLAAVALRTPSALPVYVASIDKSIGQVRIVGEQSTVSTSDGLTSIAAGQTVTTGIDGGIGLALVDGGVLRLNANTRVEFISTETVILHDGDVYFDSAPLVLANASRPDRAGRFEIQTQHGVVAHVGTRFIVSIDGDVLSVSVRDGDVSVAGTFHDAQATGGQRMTLAGQNRPVTQSIDGHGPAWAWAELTAAPVDVDNRTVYDFLRWAGHEAGLDVRFEDDGAKALADSIRLSGRIDSGASDALRVWQLTIEDLEWRIDGEAIVVARVGGDG